MIKTKNQHLQFLEVPRLWIQEAKDSLERIGWETKTKTSCVPSLKVPKGQTILIKGDNKHSVSAAIHKFQKVFEDAREAARIRQKDDRLNSALLRALKGRCRHYITNEGCDRENFCRFLHQGLHPEELELPVFALSAVEHGGLKGGKFVPIAKINEERIRLEQLLEQNVNDCETGGWEAPQSKYAMHHHNIYEEEDEPITCLKSLKFNVKNTHYKPNKPGEYQSLSLPLHFPASISSINVDNYSNKNNRSLNQHHNKEEEVEEQEEEVFLEKMNRKKLMRLERLETEKFRFEAVELERTIEKDKKRKEEEKERLESELIEIERLKQESMLLESKKKRAKEYEGEERKFKEWEDLKEPKSQPIEKKRVNEYEAKELTEKERMNQRGKRFQELDLLYKQQQEQIQKEQEIIKLKEELAAKDAQIKRMELEKNKNNKKETNTLISASSSSSPQPSSAPSSTTSPQPSSSVPSLTLASSSPSSAPPSPSHSQLVSNRFPQKYERNDETHKKKQKIENEFRQSIRCSSPNYQLLSSRPSSQFDSMSYHTRKRSRSRSKSPVFRPSRMYPPNRSSSSDRHRQPLSSSRYTSSSQRSRSPHDQPRSNTRNVQNTSSSQRSRSPHDQPRSNTRNVQNTSSSQRSRSPHDQPRSNTRNVQNTSSSQRSRSPHDQPRSNTRNVQNTSSSQRSRSPHDQPPSNTRNVQNTSSDGSSSCPTSDSALATTRTSNETYADESVQNKDTIENSPRVPNQTFNTISNIQQPASNVHTTNRSTICPYCNKNHPLSHCPLAIATYGSYSSITNLQEEDPTAYSNCLQDLVFTLHTTALQTFPDSQRAPTPEFD